MSDAKRSYIALLFLMRDLEVIDNPILVEVLNDQGIIDDILQTYAVV